MSNPYTLRRGAWLELARDLPDSCVDSIVVDPPYHLTTGKKGGCGQASIDLDSPYGRARIGTGFMGMAWDGGDMAFRVETWAEALRVLKPGGHLLAFSGTRTYHRMVCAIEDAGFEVRDQLGWVYGSGFPKSHDFAGERGADGQRVTRPEFVGHPQADGWGTALKPAWEPICLARKPLVGTVAANVLAHGTGAINVDGCRVPHSGEGGSWGAGKRPGGFGDVGAEKGGSEPCGAFNDLGRWPANIIHDGSDEVLQAFALYGERGAASPVKGTEGSAPAKNTYGELGRVPGAFHADTGTAARFFYCAKASRADRSEGLPSGADAPGNFHPTVKPTDLMRWLVRLITPPGGTVLDFCMGSGSTGKAAILEGFRFIGYDKDADKDGAPIGYLAIADARIAHAWRQVLEERRRAAANAGPVQLDLLA